MKLRSLHYNSIIFITQTDHPWVWFFGESSTIRFCRPGKPGVYTEVSYFYDWIQETIADYDKSEE